MLRKALPNNEMLHHVIVIPDYLYKSFTGLPKPKRQLVLDKLKEWTYLYDLDFYLFSSSYNFRASYTPEQNHYLDVELKFFLMMLADLKNSQEKAVNVIDGMMAPYLKWNPPA